MSRARERVALAPMALASDGTLLVNVATSYGLSDARALLERALTKGLPIFVGIVVAPHDALFARTWIDQSSMELAASIWGEAQRRRAVAHQKRKARPRGGAKR